MSAPSERNALRETLGGLLIVGRWLLVAAETMESLLFLLTRRDQGPEALPVLVLLFVYNVFTLTLVHRRAIVRRGRVVAGLLALDLGFAGLAATFTGASDSPFVGQFFLIIFAGALFYGLRGGVLVGAASALITGLLVLENPAGPWSDLGDLVPYFLIAGALTGHLVDHLHTWFRRYREGEALARRRELQGEAGRKEMDLAWEMQRAALPAAPPVVPGLEIAVRSEFAREVGGDFHLFQVEGERIALIVGDVSGKGIPAALAATSIGHLMPWLDPLGDPRRALVHLNRHLAERMPEDAFATLALAEVDGGRLRLWSAGHPPALLRASRTGLVVEACAAGGMALGLFPDWIGDARAAAVPFTTGDVLLLYSDGLIEARDGGGEQFGTERAARVLSENVNASADALADALIRAVHAWGDPADDLTILVCKRTADARP